MANIHEITRNLIQQRGEVKAALITAGKKVISFHVGGTVIQFRMFINQVEFVDSDIFTGIIWFESGSYAYLDKDGAGYYWNYIQVPEIPKELC